MSFLQTPLQSNRYLDEFDQIEHWGRDFKSPQKCIICNNPIWADACFTELGLQCKPCIIANIRSCSEAEDIGNYSLSSLREVFSHPKNLRWRFFFLFRFNEIYIPENSENQQIIYGILVHQLGYVNNHPLSWDIRQFAYKECLNQGKNIVPVMINLYRSSPWQLSVNIIALAIMINPKNKQLPSIVKEAAKHKNVEVRMRTMSSLKPIINNRSFPWVNKVIMDMCDDPDPSVRKLAMQYAKLVAVIEKTTFVQSSLPVIKKNQGKTLLDLYEQFRPVKNPQQIEFENFLDDIYGMTALRHIFISYLIPMFKSQNLIDKNIKTIKSIKKRYLITIFGYVIKDKNLCLGMLDTMPHKTREIFEFLVWDGGVHEIKTINKQFNIRILTESIRIRFDLTDSILPEFHIFQISGQYDYQKYTYKGLIGLHSRLRTIFKQYLPIPQKANLNSIKNISDQYFRYSDNNQFSEQADFFLEYIRQGNIQHTKTTGEISKASLKKMHDFFHIHEFYSGNDTQLDYLYLRLIINFLQKIDTQTKNLKKIENVKKILADYFTMKNFGKYSLFNVLPHIKGEIYNNEFYEKQVRISFFKLLRRISNFKWIEIDNLITNIKCGSDSFDISEHYNVYNFLSIKMNTKYYYRHFNISEELYNDVCLIPLIKGMFFLFASLGLVNIVYDTPKNKLHKVFNNDYLSVYDGLKYIQLTDFGKYVVDISESYTVKTTKTPTKIYLDEKRLFISLEGDGRLERMILERFAEPISENYYKISYQSFLKDCQSSHDIKNNISLFKEKITSNLPSNWKEFFKEIEEKTNPLQPKENLKIYKITPNKELITLIARDDYLKRNILKVENYHIAIKSANISKVKKRLKDFGFFIDNI